MNRPGFTSGAMTALAVLVIGATIGAYSGIYDVSATRPHGRVTRWFLATTALHSIRAHAARAPEVRLPDDPRSIDAGFAAYDAMCVQCHGAPGVPRDWVGEGMEPSPPDLQEVARTWKPEEIYWVVQNGIKSTGMPALGATHDEDEVRDVAAFVMKLGAMSKDDYATLRKKHRSEKHQSLEGLQPRAQDLAGDRMANERR